MTAATSIAPAVDQPWQIDPTHTEIEFSARHLMISNVKGRFSNPTGSVAVDPANPAAAGFEITIPVGTIDTRNEQRDAHLRSADFFDVDHFPMMTFKAKRIDGDITEQF